jgi:hypothetical protein
LRSCQQRSGVDACWPSGHSSMRTPVIIRKVSRGSRKTAVCQCAQSAGLSDPIRALSTPSFRRWRVSSGGRRRACLRPEATILGRQWHVCCLAHVCVAGAPRATQDLGANEISGPLSCVAG